MAVVVAAVAGVATSTAVAGMASVAIYGAVTAAAIGALAGAVVSGIVGSALISPASAGGFEAIGVGILTNRNVNNAPIPVIYGTRLSGGTIVFMDFSEVDRQWFYVNLVFSEGVIEGYDGYFFNTQPQKAEDLVQVEEFFGTETQAANTRLTSMFPHYTSAHRLKSTAYVTFYFKFSPFKAGLPLITALVKGIKIYDPRDNTTHWSDNPSLCLYNYLTNTRYGRGIETSLIDEASFILAANYCDEIMNYGTWSGKRYTCDGVAETQRSSLSIIKQLLSSCRGMLIFSGGLYKIIIDKPEIPAFWFTEDNIIGGWKIRLGNKNNRFNRMKANFFNKAKEYQADIATIEISPEGDEGILETMIDLPFTTDYLRAKVIIAINLAQSRRSISCEFTSTIEGLRVEVGDVVYIKHATPNWIGIGKEFRIMRVTLQNNDEVRIIANEYDVDVYDVGEIEVEPNVPDVPTYDSSVCLPPTNLDYITFPRNERHPNSDFLLFGWDSSPDPLIQKYEVNYAPQETDEWQVYYTEYSIFSRYFYDEIRYPAYFVFRVRAINTIGVKSEWLE